MSGLPNGREVLHRGLHHVRVTVQSGVSHHQLGIVGYGLWSRHIRASDRGVVVDLVRNVLFYRQGKVASARVRGHRPGVVVFVFSGISDARDGDAVQSHTV